MARIICFSTYDDYQVWFKKNPSLPEGRVFDLNGPVSGITEKDREQFLRAYVDVIGQLSAHNHSLYWWATDISSKNRFFSPLVNPLEKLFKILCLHSRHVKEDMVFIGVPVLLKRSLEEWCASNRMQLLWNIKPAVLPAVYVYEWLLKVARVLRHIVYIVPRIVYARRKLGVDVIQSSRDQNSVYVFKTFAAARAFNAQGQYKDLFFGAAVDHVAQKHHVIILAEVLDHFKNTVDLLVKSGQSKIFPLESFLTAGDLFKASLHMVVYRWKVPVQVDFYGRNISGLLKQLAASGGDKIQPLQMYHYYAMQKLLKQFSVHAFALTCEFNPWEKLCIWAVREQKTPAKILGYQHAVVPQASVNMFTSRFEESIIPKPDTVLTVGEAPKTIIHHYETCAPSAVTACAGLRFEYLFGQPQPTRENRGHILLALEGLPQVAPMTSYVLSQWKDSQGRQLRIRTHPVLPINQFIDQLSHDPRHMPQVVVSQGTSLKEDLLWADIVIYWGTTVSLEAISLGKPVIHYDNGFLLSYDPLFELKDFHWVITPESSLLDIITNIYNLPAGEYDRQRDAAQAYISRYFYPVSKEALDNFLI